MMSPSRAWGHWEPPGKGRAELGRVCHIACGSASPLPLATCPAPRPPWAVVTGVHHPTKTEGPLPSAPPAHLLLTLHLLGLVM